MKEITAKCLSMVLVRRRFCEWIFNFAPAQTRTHTEWQHRHPWKCVCGTETDGRREKSRWPNTHILPLKAWARMRTITFENLCVDRPSANHERRPTIGTMPNVAFFGFVWFRQNALMLLATIRPHFTQWPVSGHFRSHSCGTIPSFCIETNVHFRMFTHREVGRQFEHLFATHDRALGSSAFQYYYIYNYRNGWCRTHWGDAPDRETLICQAMLRSCRFSRYLYPTRTINTHRRTAE